MLIVDASVWIDYFNGTVNAHTDMLDQILGHREIGIGDITLCEVLQGLRRQKDFDTAREAMLQFPVFTMGGAHIALKAAENYRSLRRKGITIRKIVDCLIATFVIENRFYFLHRDHDFVPFERKLGLMTVDPTEH